MTRCECPLADTSDRTGHAAHECQMPATVRVYRPGVGGLDLCNCCHLTGDQNRTPIKEDQ